MTPDIKRYGSADTPVASAYCQKRGTLGRLDALVVMVVYLDEFSCGITVFPRFPQRIMLDVDTIVSLYVVFARPPQGPVVGLQYRVYSLAVHTVGLANMGEGEFADFLRRYPTLGNQEQ